VVYPSNFIEEVCGDHKALNPQREAADGQEERGTEGSPALQLHWVPWRQRGSAELYSYFGTEGLMTTTAGSDG
jgi:hypothetical protein